jgi:hypothetical protein
MAQDAQKNAAASGITTMYKIGDYLVIGQTGF